MTPHRMTVAKTAHFYTLGKPGPPVRQLWIACHGYAQLADEFLQDIKTACKPFSKSNEAAGLISTSTHFREGMRFLLTFSNNYSASFPLEHYKNRVIQYLRCADRQSY